MRSHSSPFSDLKTAAQQQAATTAGRTTPVAPPAVAPVPESAAEPDSAAELADLPTIADSARRPAVKRSAQGSAASEVAALRQKPRQRIVDVHGFRVAVPVDEMGRIVATTVQLPYELRDATREAERLTGRSYQDLARLGLRLVLEQLSEQAPGGAVTER